MSEAGERMPFFQVENSSAANRRHWAELPKHYWGIAGEARPGAAVLAKAKFDGPTMKGDANLVLLQNYGFGKVLFVGIDSTWRWRYRVGDHYHHLFWGQLLRWTGADPWLAEGSGKVRFGTRSASNSVA